VGCVAGEIVISPISCTVGVTSVGIGVDVGVGVGIRVGVTIGLGVRFSLISGSSGMHALRAGYCRSSGRPWVSSIPSRFKVRSFGTPSSSQPRIR